ncbi:MAG: alpha/beta hydrolase [Acidimicrobiia bacterium]|nr:alpha/beta hydrolase [Acidimicrobiia bacterium]
MTENTAQEQHPTHLRDLADPAVDTIVMVPGLDGTAELFYRQQPLLARHFNVVAFPLPNRRFGTMHDLSDDLATLVDEVSIDGAILVGESFGGALSMTTALRHPDLVKGLVIVNSFPYLDNRLQLRVAPWLIRAMPWAAMPVVRRITEHRLHSAHTLPEDLAEFRKRMLKIGRNGYIRRLELLNDYDIRGDLPQINVPALIVAGTDDRLVPSARWARYLGRHLPDVEVLLLDGYGHCCLINHDLDLDAHVHRWWSSRSANQGTEREVGTDAG